MKTISVAEAKTHLSALLDAVEAGEEITITRHGRPVARVIAIANLRKSPLRSLAPVRAGMPMAKRASVHLLREMRDEAADRVEGALAPLREPRRRR